MKTCFKCGQLKPLSEFYVHKRMADGHLNKCKECTKIDVWNRAHGEGRDKILAYERERAKTDKRKELRLRVTKQYRLDHPDRSSANQRLVRAVRAGKIKKLPCMICGDENTVGHHVSYDLPYDVSWLCQSHHKQLHAEHRS